jgi:hypothetical protein
MDMRNEMLGPQKTCPANCGGIGKDDGKVRLWRQRKPNILEKFFAQVPALVGGLREHR